MENNRPIPMITNSNTTFEKPPTDIAHTLKVGKVFAPNTIIKMTIKLEVGDEVFDAITYSRTSEQETDKCADYYRFSIPSQNSSAEITMIVGLTRN